MARVDWRVLPGRALHALILKIRPSAPSVTCVRLDGGRFSANVYIL